MTTPKLTELKIRVAWAKDAAKMHAWTNDGVPPMENGKFVCGWHESEFQLFSAGARFAENSMQDRFAELELSLENCESGNQMLRRQNIEMHNRLHDIAIGKGNKS